MPRGIQKDENKEWDLFEDLAEKTLQWESTLEKFRNRNPISSKGGLHSIESSAETKISSLMRRLEALEQGVSSSQSSQPRPIFKFRLYLLSNYEPCV